ncbi:PREDICTED: CUE domain-containing protein 2-like [Priapulus caudatus]|uniref:CUE domain-containing protein 2-like n=1 Tax=Priapulus caudatus TaxID=37621 RepID=A0ABM1EG82_PRICU|nr:PREDICTED: CUE domain-containing protein 2-like [Priapulus caudatus]
MTSPSTWSEESLIKKELQLFLRQNIPLALLGTIDDIILNYIVCVLESLGSSSNSGEESFDVDQFVEMLDAHFSGFAAVESEAVCKWVYSLATKLSEQRQQSTDGGTRTRNTSETSVTSLEDMFGVGTPSSLPAPLSHRTISTSSDKENHDCEKSQDSHSAAGASAGSSWTHEHVHLLMEMFPSAGEINVNRCLSVAAGDVEAAAQLLLCQPEDGSSSVSHGSLSKVHKHSVKKHDVCGMGTDKQLRNLIIEKYAYVDQAEDHREHHPPPPKYESKKMIRYREGQVVSMKGERFTEIKQATDERMKKTFVSLKPARQYRFH